MKGLLLIFSLLFSSLSSADQIILKNDTDENKNVTILLKSLNPVDDVSMTGSLKVKVVGDYKNTITGEAILIFTRKSDSQKFTIEAPVFGFKPDRSCEQNYWDDEINLCILEDPIEYNIDFSALAPKDDYGSREPMEYLTLSNNLLRVVSMHTGNRGFSEYDVYKVINNKDVFSAEFIYRIPEDAKFNDDGSFTYSLSGSAVSGQTITVGEVDGKWINVKEVTYFCGDQNYTDWPQVYKVFEFNKVTGNLELTLDESSCPQ